MRSLAGSSAQMAGRAFKIVLIKPSHYDEDGYRDQNNGVSRTRCSTK
jgi:hypothetical protein